MGSEPVKTKTERRSEARPGQSPARCGPAARWTSGCALALLLVHVASGTPAGAESPADAIAREIAEQQRQQEALEAAEAERAEAERASRESAIRAAEAAEAEQLEAAQRGYESRIADEMATQEKLLWQATGRGDQPDSLVMPTGDLETDAYLDPRIAPPPPENRDLPLEIFDQHRLRVPADVWGGRKHPAYDAVKLVLDADGDGHPELIRFIDQHSGVLLRQEADTNYDGTLDTWDIYEDGVIVARRLDRNDDGRPDTWDEFVGGRAVSRERDRDDDGVRDIFYAYEDGVLVRESHDANDDGRIDLVIHYVNGHRERSEEDVDRDGRMDTWTTYVVSDDGRGERIRRKERDRLGDGKPDTVEIFGDRDGQAVLERLEEDKDGDGRPDVVSIYENGKLKRRQILAPGA